LGERGGRKGKASPPVALIVVVGIELRGVAVIGLTALLAKRQRNQSYERLAKNGVRLVLITLNHYFPNGLYAR